MGSCEFTTHIPRSGEFTTYLSRSDELAANSPVGGALDDLAQENFWERAPTVASTKKVYEA